MDLLQRYKNFILDHQLFQAADNLLLAVSGGVDSVALCELCRQAGFSFSIVHCNFQLRGEESMRDEEFVRQLGVKYGVEVRVKRLDTQRYALDHKISVQEAARAQRYAWFEELLTESTGPATCLITAHHADDNAETVLMNFCRGTGLKGLTGIPVKHGHIARPLLSFTKNELIQFAKENNLGYVEDSSNLSTKYTRNLFRHEIIPAISKVYPQVKENLMDNIGRFKEIEKLYNMAVAALKKKLMHPKGNEWHIPVKQLMGFENRALIYEIISAFGFTEKQIDEVIRLAQSESGKYIESPQFHYRLIRHRHWFIISPSRSAESATIIIDEKDKNIIFENGVLYFENLSAPALHSTSADIALLDLKNITYPLILRKWKTGDYFYPLGMLKKKKLSRFFIDQKLSRPDKEKVWVLESDKRIIWVVGHRIDERFKVTDKTEKILRIRASKS